MRTLAAVLLIAALAGCQGGTRPDDPDPPAPKGECPKVHARRHDIPIVYGPLKQDPETSRARWERKFVYGGPTEGAHAPRITEICDDCGYVYDPRRDVWERESANTDNFLIPLNPLIQHPPEFASNMKTRPGLYRQAFKGEALFEESYSAVTAIRVEDVWARILDRLKGAEGAQLLEDAPKRKHIRARLNGWSVEAKVTKDPVTLGTEYRLWARKGS